MKWEPIIIKNNEQFKKKKKKKGSSTRRRSHCGPHAVIDCPPHGGILPETAGIIIVTLI